MKKTRKFAALLAALMCVSGMGAMNVSAADINSSSGTAEVGLKAYMTDDTNLTYASTQTWKITVEGTELVWEITKTGNAVQNLVWDGREYRPVELDASDVTYDIITPNKMVVIKNNSNFAVTPHVTVNDNNATTDVNESEWFTSSGASEIASLGEGTVGIAPARDTAGPQYLICKYLAGNNDYFTSEHISTASNNPTLITNATISFTKAGDTLTQYDNKPVIDKSTP